MELVKVKSHVTDEEFQNGIITKENLDLNHAADKLAEAAAQRNEPGSDGVQVTNMVDKRAWMIPKRFIAVNQAAAQKRPSKSKRPQARSKISIRTNQKH